MAGQLPYDEPSVLLSVAEGDENSFAVLVNHHWNKIYSMAVAYLKSSSLAQDLVQDVFMKVWLKREELPGVRDFDSWLFIMARNLLLSTLRTSKSRKTYSGSIIEELAETTGSSGQHYDYRYLNQLLQKALEQLPPQQKLIFQLSHEQGLSHEEICERLGIARQTLKNHLVRAMVTLRTYIQSNGELFIGLLILTMLN